MPVPLLDLNGQNLALEAELQAAFTRVLRSGQFIQGREVTMFEERIAALTGARHAIGVSSGTDAILLALMAAGIGPGDEVLCPTFTFFATAGCIARVGATPVFVDAESVSFNLNIESAARKITSRTRAIIPVHLFGQCAEMDAILALAARHHLIVIEDAAQSLGAGYHGRQAGTMGDFGTYSFFPSKNLGGFGDGGMLVTNDGDLADKARLLRTHGAKPKYYHKLVGGNFRLDALQGALLSVKLPHYQRYTQRRQENAAYYSDQLGRLRGVAAGGSPGAGDASIVLPAVLPGRVHIWNQYTLQMPGKNRRDALHDFLAKTGIGSEIYYPRAMHQQDCFAHLGYGAGDLPVAARLCGDCLSLPIYPELSWGQLDEVIAGIASFLHRHPSRCDDPVPFAPNSQ